MWFDEAVADATLPRRLNRRVFSLALVLVAAVLAVSGFGPMLNNVDLGWHVAQGRWMFQHGTFYRHDVLNYATYGRSIVDEYPLFQGVLFLFWKLGWWGPGLLTTLGYLGLSMILIRSASEARLTGSAWFILGLGVVLIDLQAVFPLRPHLVTFLGVAATGRFLLRHRDSRHWREFWPLALVQAAWANSHGGFVLGPAMAGLFGLEMTVREAWRQRAFPLSTAHTWAAVIILLLLASCLNPAGAAIFYPPLFQERLEAIRAYVGEMEPFTGGLAVIYDGVAVMALAAMAGAWWRRGDLAWSFIILAALALAEAYAAKKAWPLFGLFVALAIISSGILGRERPAGPLLDWLRFFGNFALASLLAMALLARIDPALPSSFVVAWREYDAGRSELSLRAVAWMRQHGLEGRLLHRCEDGGILQQSGYDHGETFGDTGFGKYDEAFIRTISLISERPALLPQYLAFYRPPYVVCDNFAYNWPWFLRQAGWRLIFYSPYSAVWTQAGTRPDLPTVSDGEIEAAFDADLAAHGRPADITMLGRNILELNSLGREDFALKKLTSLPPEFHRAPWYWEAARIMCFERPRMSAAHRAQLAAEAEADPCFANTEFRAYALDAAGKSDDARQFLRSLPPASWTGRETDLLMRIELAEHAPEVIHVAEQTHAFDLRDGWHWADVAQAEDQAGHEAAALAAWKKAVFYEPDEAELMTEAKQFSARHPDAELQRAIAAGVNLTLPPDAPSLPVR